MGPMASGRCVVCCAVEWGLPRLLALRSGGGWHGCCDGMPHGLRARAVHTEAHPPPPPPPSPIAVIVFVLDVTFSPSPRFVPLGARVVLSTRLVGRVGEGVWGQKQFVYLKWASHVWLSVEDFILPSRKSPQGEVVKSSAGAGVMHPPPFLGVVFAAYPKA